jgi:hypothetical protein
MALTDDRMLELWEMVLDYSGEQQCSIEEAIADLEFDGPNGSYGPTKEEREYLLAAHRENEEWEAANCDPDAEELKSYIPGVGFLVTNLGTAESHIFFEGEES